MTDINDKLHPKLKEILAVPENPDATPVEEQTPDEARAEWKGARVQGIVLTARNE